MPDLLLDSNMAMESSLFCSGFLSQSHPGVTLLGCQRLTTMAGKSVPHTLSSDSERPRSRMPRIPVPRYHRVPRYHPEDSAEQPLPTKDEHIPSQRNEGIAATSAESESIYESHQPLKPAITLVTVFTESVSRDMSTHMPTEDPLEGFPDEYFPHRVHPYPSALRPVHRPSPLRKVVHFSSSDSSDEDTFPQPLDKDKPLPALPSREKEAQHISAEVASVSDKSSEVWHDAEEHSQKEGTSTDKDNVTAESVDMTSLTASERQKWLVCVDIEHLVRVKDVEELLRAKKEQMSLAIRYRSAVAARGMRSSDPRTLVMWHQLIAAISHKETNNPQFRAALERSKVEGGTVSRAQYTMLDRLTTAIATLTGQNSATQTAMRLDLGKRPSSAFHGTGSLEWKIVPAWRASGPTIDNCGAIVEHHLLISRNALIDHTGWSDEDLEVIKRNGLGGFVGFKGTSAVGLNFGEGHSGMPGVNLVETIIKTLCNPERYKVCWMSDSFATQQEQEIKVVHLWVANKKSPSLSHLQKLTQYMQMVNDDG